MLRQDAKKGSPTTFSDALGLMDHDRYLHEERVYEYNLNHPLFLHLQRHETQNAKSNVSGEGLIEKENIVNRDVPSQNDGVSLKTSPTHERCYHMADSLSNSALPIQRLADENFPTSKFLFSDSAFLNETLGISSLPFVSYDNFKCKSPKSPTSSVSGPSVTCDPSTDFDTESTYDDEASDLEDEEFLECPSTLNALALIKEKVRAETKVSQMSIFGPTLSPMKRALVDSVIKDFWAIFSQKLSSNIRQCTDSSSACSSQKGFQDPRNPKSASTLKIIQRKRQRDHSDSHDDEDEDDRAPK
ncbi:hypothetical protein HYALB_00013108 [Hymenoscyphus albidus]|uniref:Uncharacterized protein n=1 Tax=Hymenoscyphus albidus TaxID=595503 RepID=A0A9N9Q7W5_9HELO|nr:hypothetical protein HYALB_00013108 [Hymenoscyphus albidus]